MVEVEPSLVLVEPSVELVDPVVASVVVPRVVEVELVMTGSVVLEEPVMPSVIVPLPSVGVDPFEVDDVVLVVVVVVVPSPVLPPDEPDAEVSPLSPHAVMSPARSRDPETKRVDLNMRTA